MSVIKFTVEFDLLGIVSDGVDGGVEADEIGLQGTVVFTPVLPKGDHRPFLAPEFSPRPAGIKVLPITGYIDSDGRLKSGPGGSVGVRLPANDPVLGRDSLPYLVEFNVRAPAGEKVRVQGGYFEAPTDDVTINLAEVLQPTSTPSGAITRIAPGGVRLEDGNIVWSFGGEDIPNPIPVEDTYPSWVAGAGEVGQELAVAETPAEAWSTLGTLPNTSLPTDLTDIGYDILLVIGQSNSLGSVAGAGAINALDTTYLDAPDERISQWPQVGNLVGLGRGVRAVDPLLHYVQATGCVGPAMNFCRELLRRLPSNRRILIVPAGRGATAFTTSSLSPAPSGYRTSAGGGWDVSGNQGGINLYELAISAANAAMASGPNNRMLAAIWVQGESDTSDLTQSQYAAHLDALIDGMRSRITGATNMPFVIGQMLPEYIAATAGAVGINAAHIDTPRRKLLCAFNYGVSGYAADSPTVHYSNEGNRRNGLNMAATYSLAIANVLDTPPVTPGTVTLTQSGTSVTASWVRTAGRVTDYNVRYRVDAGSWSTLTRSQSIDATETITGFSSGQAVDVQVRAVNEQGTSGWSASGSLTLVYAPGQASIALGTPTGGAIPYTITAPTVDGTHAAATSYVVEYKETSGSTYTALAASSSLTGTITGLAYSTSYTVRVTAFNAAGSGTVSTTQAATTAAPVALIDDVGVTAFRAIGLRKLTAAYAGSAVRVRYTNGTEADIGFVSGTNDLDTTTLLAGAAANGGGATIKTWYDQSGNARNYTQSTASAQARIVNSNTLDAKNSKPAALFAVSYYSSADVGLYAAGASSYLATFASTKGAASGFLTTERQSSSGGAAYNGGYHGTDGIFYATLADNTPTTWAQTNAGTLTDGALTQISFVDTGTNIRLWRDGTAGGAGTTYSRSGRTVTLATSVLGSASGLSSAAFSGQLGELVQFDSALTDAQRLVGQANQQAYYATA